MSKHRKVFLSFSERGLLDPGLRRVREIGLGSLSYPMSIFTTEFLGTDLNEAKCSLLYEKQS